MSASFSVLIVSYMLLISFSWQLLCNLSSVPIRFENSRKSWEIIHYNWCYLDHSNALIIIKMVARKCKTVSLKMPTRQFECGLLVEQRVSIQQTSFPRGQKSMAFKGAACYRSNHSNFIRFLYTRSVCKYDEECANFKCFGIRNPRGTNPFSEQTARKT